MANAEIWSRCGCVIKYVDTHSRTTCNAFARALSNGKGSPAKGPCSSTLVSGSTLELQHESELSYPASLDARPGVLDRPLPLDFFGVVRSGGFALTAPVLRGKSASRIRVIEARWEPASTARIEFLFQFVEIERTRKPVTLSSAGPPPDAWIPCQRSSRRRGPLIALKRYSILQDR